MSDYSGIVADLDEQTYHAHPALSSTGARQLLDSPARFRYSQDNPQAHKAAFDLGTAVHSKVLGVGSDVVSLDFDSFRSKAAQEARDSAYNAGKVPMLAKDLTIVDDMAESVLSHPTARVLFEQEGQAEASVFAVDPDTGVEVRARFDFLPNLANRNPIAVDLKTTGKEASKEGFAKSVASFGYDVQQGHYLHTLALAVQQEIPMVFAVVETEPPHLVAVHQIDILWTEMGVAKARRARELFAECTKANDWPGYPTGVELISPPTWAVYQHEEKYL